MRAKNCRVSASPTGRFFALLRMTGWGFALLFASASFGVEPVPDKTVVLTFDDAVKSQVTNVAPLLKEYGFGATFFVTQCWMKDPAHFMSWEDAAALHRMGFEIGNHTWTHDDFGKPEVGARLGQELAQVERELARVGVPKPVSFAWPGNSLGPEALGELRKAGYQLARRGMQPEVKYGEIVPGPLYEPGKHDPLLIPTSGDGYPGWTLEHFKRVVNRARDGKIVVLQFHGVPDDAHPWVTTPLERFREYMAFLKQEGFRCVALREVERYIDRSHPPVDPLAQTLSRSREDFPPEQGIDLNAEYDRAGGKVNWKAYHVPDKGLGVDFEALYTPGEQVTAHALTYVESPVEQTVALRFGSNDSGKVWVGGKLVDDFNKESWCILDRDIISVTLPKGKTPILPKATTGVGAWALALRFNDADGDPISNLTYSDSP